MAGRAHGALASVVAMGCLFLTGCAASSAATSGPDPTASPSPFCARAARLMGHIADGPRPARRNLAAVLRATVAGYTALDAQAPVRLHRPLRAIIGIYRGDEQVVASTSDLSQISQSLARRDAAGAASFRAVVTYIAANCR